MKTTKIQKQIAELRAARGGLDDPTHTALAIADEFERLAAFVMRLHDLRSDAVRLALRPEWTDTHRTRYSQVLHEFRKIRKEMAAK